MSSHSHHRPELASLLAVLTVAVLGFANTAQAEITPQLLFSETGAIADDEYGYSGESAGDFNNDGYEDLIIGAQNSPGFGSAYVFFGGPGADDVADVTLQGDNVIGDLFGRRVAGVGDYNGDGIDDIVVGADKSASNDKGWVFVFFGSTSPDGIADLGFEGEETAGNEQFGYSVSAAGDVNADGYADFIVGARWSDAGGSNTDEGRAYVYFGGPSADSVADLVFLGENVGDSVGVWVGAGGDLNGDGFDDFVVGAPGLDIDGTNAGGAYVFYGGPNVDNVPDLVFIGKAGGNLGERLDGVGDLNGDGYDDLALGDSTNDDVGNNAGRALLYWGGPDVDTAADLVIVGEAAASNFGLDLSRGGDLNGDGWNDLIVGAYRYSNDDSTSREGRAYVYYGGPDIDTLPDIVLSGEAQEDEFGFALSSVGDYNADGIDDFFVGARLHDDGQTNTGKAYIYSGPGSYGGCCLPGGCMDLTELECTALEGTPLPDGVFCADNDTDGDGTPDFCDECPTNPDKILAGECGCETEETLVVSYESQTGTNGNLDGEFNRPEGIAVDVAGRVYVADARNDRVQVFDADFQHLLTFGSTGTGNGQLDEATDVDVRGNRVYVLEQDNHRVSVFDTSGNFLFLFGGQGSGAGQFESPKGLAVDSAGRVIVGDSQNSRMQVFDPDGVFLFEFGSFGSGPGQFSTCIRRVAVDAADRIYVVDSCEDRVQVFDAVGNYLHLVGDGAFESPIGVAVEKVSGRVYVSDNNLDRVKVFSSGGDLLTTFGSNGNGDGQFGQPRGLAVRPGVIYVTDQGQHRVQEFNDLGCLAACCLPNGCMDLFPADCSSLGGTVLPGGLSCDDNDFDGDGVTDACDECPNDPTKILAGDCGCGASDPLTGVTFSGTEFGSAGSGPGQFKQLRGIDIDAAGRIYTVETGSLKGGDNVRVQVFDDTGSQVLEFGPFHSGGNLLEPNDIEVGPDGRIHVLEGLGSRVSIFDPTGTYLEEFGTFGSLDGDLNFPNGLTIDSQGRVIVADTGNNRISIWDAAGNFVTNFGTLGSDLGQLNTPWDVATDDRDRIFVTENTNNRVSVFDPDGTPLFTFGGPGFLDDEFDGPLGIDIDFFGRVHIVDGENDQVKVWDLDGDFLLAYGSGEFFAPAGVAVDLGGKAWVTDSDAAQTRVARYHPDPQDVQLEASDGILETGTVLSWSPICNMDALWKIKRDGVQIAVLPQSDSTFVDTGGLSTVVYTYELTFVDRATGFEASDTDTGFRTIFAPDALTATDQSREDGVELRWNDRSSIESNYLVYRRDAGSGDSHTLLETVDSDIRVYLDESAALGQRYEYCVEAVAADGGTTGLVCDNGGPLVEGEIGSLNAPTAVAASNGVFVDSVVVTWNDVTSLEDGYIVSKRAAGTMDAFAFLDTVEAGATRYADTSGLGSAWTYSVEAFFYDPAVVVSSRSLDDGIGGADTMTPPANVTASVNDFDDRITIIWDDPGLDDDKFIIYREGQAIGEVSGTTTQFNDLDVAAAVSTEYCVQAVSDLGGTSLQSAACASGTRSEIVAPIDLTATEDEFENLTALTWDTESTTSAVFEVLRDGIPIKILPGSARSYNDKEGQSGVTYTYHVRGLTVTKTASDTTGGAVSGSRKLGLPTDVDATDNTIEDRVKLTWTDNSLFETGYQVLRRVAGDTFPPDLLAELPRNRTGYADLTADVGVEYEYSVVPIDAYGADATPVADSGSRKLSSVTDLRASDDQFEDRILVEWKDESAAETGFDVWRDGVRLATVPANSESYADSGLAVGAYHTYEVFPIDDQAPGMGPDSPPADTPSDTGSTDLLSPASVSASDTYLDKVTISWIDRSNSETGYEIGYGDDPSELITLGVVPADATTYEDPSPAPADEERQYYVRTLSAERSSELQFDRGRVLSDQALASTIVTESGFFVQSGLINAIDVDGDVAAIGGTGTGDPPGVRILRRDEDGVWNLEYTIPSSTSGPNKPRTVRISGDDLCVLWFNSGSNEPTEFYRKSGTTWNKVGDGPSNVFALEMEGPTAVFAISTGSTAAWRNTGGSWQQNLLVGFSSGGRIAADRERFAFTRSTDLETFAYEFSTSTGSYEFQYQIPRASQSADYASSIAMEGELILKGSDDGIYLFDQTTQVPFPYSPVDQFPRVHIDGQFAVIEDDVDYAPVFYPDPELGWIEIIRVLGEGQTGRPLVHLGDGSLMTRYVDFNSPNPIYVTDLLGPPELVTASDNEFENKVQISWEDGSALETSFNVLRDGAVIAQLPANSRNYSDFDALPGIAHTYQVVAVSNAFGEFPGVADIGRRKADGFIGGRITSRAGTGVRDVTVCLDPPAARSLLFDGEGGYVVAEDGLPLGTGFTVETWATLQDVTGSETRILWASTDGQYIVGTVGTVLVVQTPANSFSYAVPTDRSWHHYAVTVSATDVPALYQDGVFRPNEGARPERPITLNNPARMGTSSIDVTIGGDPAGDFWWSGQVDDTRVWSRVLSVNEISGNRFGRIDPAAENLWAYLTFDEPSGITTSDLTQLGHHGELVGGVGRSDFSAPLQVCATTDAEGNYAIAGILYGDGRSFEVIPSSEDRAFEPTRKIISIDQENPVANEVAFGDITSYGITGFVGYENTACSAEGIEILVDGVLSAQTDANGEFELSVAPGAHTIVARAEGLEIEPAEIEINADRDLANQDFEITTTRRLTLSVGGGCPGVEIGDITLTATSPDGCRQVDIVITDTDQIELPPLEFRVEVTNVTNAPAPLNNGLIQDFFDFNGPQIIDLASEDGELSFLYRAPVTMTVAGLPEWSCGPFIGPDNQVVSGTPDGLMKMLDVATLTFSVFEDYGSVTCPVDSGTVTIFDEVADRTTPQVVSIADGIATYPLIAARPNTFSGRTADGLNRSFQKAFIAVADVDGSTDRLTRWVVVEGARPRSGTFYSGITEDNPILILHDPPGDQSYSYWERGLEACTLIGSMTIDGDGDTQAVDLQAGLDISIGASIGFLSISKDARAVGSVGFAFEHEASTTDDGDVQYCVRTTQRFTTSDDDLFVGPPGDVFVGSAMNVLFAPADNLTIDGSSCQASTFESIRFGLDGEEPFATTFAYTRGHIENVLIPQFERLMLSPSAADSVDIYQNQIDNWEAQLALADSLTARGLRGENVENRSFSAGAIFESTTEADSSSVTTKTTRIYSKDETLGGFNFKNGGFGLAGNFSGNVSYETNTLTGSSADTTLTTGYVLADDDVGDFFTTDVGIDPTYGTPVFELRSGTSSCPWEPGTAPRDSVGIILDQYILNDQDPNAPAELRLTMTNFSKELREYYLRSEEIENVGGATIKVNGIDAAVPRSFFIGPEQSKDIVVTVERGPRLFNYPNLRLQAIPPCELELFRRGDQLRLATNVDFSVFFQAPCSDITISSPQSGWVFNKDDEIATGNTLTVRLSDFLDQLSENGDEEVSGVNVAWRRVGSPDGFAPILNQDLTADDLRDINGDVLPSIDVLWDLSSRDDGRYELRAYTKCEFNGSVVYSNISSGTIDRTDPQPFGDPEPADQELALGDQIQIDFNETIDCNSVSLQTVELTVTGQPDPIPVDLECNGTSIIIDPAPLGLYEGRTATVRIGQLDPQNPDQTVFDVAGNPLLGRDDISRTESWTFDIRLSEFAWANDFIVQATTFEAGGAVGAKLVNGNETDLDFDITGVPGWLTPSVSSGTITAGGTFDVEFAFPDSLGQSIIQNFPDSTATFQATVTADVTTPPLSVPLDIRVDVTCGPPTWNVNAGLFEYTMSAVVQLNIDSEISSDPDDIVAAFVGNQLRGVSRVEGDQAFLTIYSNRAVGEIVRFKIFDASMCDLYGASDRTVRFEVDKRWGNPSAPQVLTALDVVPGVTQSIDAGEGWTWFSLNLLDQDMTIFTVLGDLNPQPGDVVKSQTEFSVLDENLEWQGSLTEFDNREGYLINLTESGTILHQGDAVSGALPIQISPGWNWVGYPPANSDSVNVAMASFAANDFDVIKSQTEFAQFINGLGWTGSLKVMEPGQGYKLYSGQQLPGVLMFPPNPAPLARGQEIADGGPGVDTGKFIRTNEPRDRTKRSAAKSQELSPALESAFDLGWSLPQRGFQHNMTMIANVELEGALLSAPAVLAAFVGEEVRGVAELTPLGFGQAVAFLMIHSDEAENEEVTFQVLNTQTDRLYDVQADIDFVADGSLGTIEAPWTLHAVPSLGDSDVPLVFQLSESFPNPARLSPAQIGYALPIESQVEIELFDVQGRSVRTLVDGVQPAGRHIVEVDPMTLTSGVYFYRMRTDSFEQVRKLTVLR